MGPWLSGSARIFLSVSVPWIGGLKRIFGHQYFSFVKIGSWVKFVFVTYGLLNIMIIITYLFFCNSTA